MFKFITFANAEFYSFISMSCCLTAGPSIISRRRYKRRHTHLVFYLKRNPVFHYGSLMLVGRTLIYTLSSRRISIFSAKLLIFKTAALFCLMPFWWNCGADYEFFFASVLIILIGSDFITELIMYSQSKSYLVLF